MILLEVVGAITILYAVGLVSNVVYRRFVPKKITKENCRADHDTMTRYGASRCSMCNTKLNEY